MLKYYAGRALIFLFEWPLRLVGLEIIDRKELSRLYELDIH